MDPTVNDNKKTFTPSVIIEIAKWHILSFKWKKKNSTYYFTFSLPSSQFKSSDNYSDMTGFTLISTPVVMEMWLSKQQPSH